MFSTADTIVAIATPPGRGALGVVRLSGPDAVRIAEALLGRDRSLEPRQATFGRIVEGDADAVLARVDRWYIPRRDVRYVRRNALVVLGNVGDGRDPVAADLLARYAVHDDPLLRGHAAWAARRLGPAAPQTSPPTMASTFSCLVMTLTPRSAPPRPTRTPRRLSSVLRPSPNRKAPTCSPSATSLAMRTASAATSASERPLRRATASTIRR